MIISIPQILIEYDGNEDSWTCFGSAQVGITYLNVAVGRFVFTKSI